MSLVGPLVLDAEQQMLQTAARDFVATRSSIARVRALREDPIGFSHELWSEMAGLGWLGLTIPEAYGGAGAGHRALMVVLEELGAGLVPEPILDGAVLGAMAILRGGDEALRAEWLPRVAAGERLVALAYQEGRSRYALDRVAARAERAEGGWRVSGEKVQVAAGSAADAYVVSARTTVGLSLFLVPAAGVTRERQHRLDGRDAAILGLAKAPALLLGEEGQGGALLGAIVDAGAIALCADMLGTMRAAFAMTLQHLKTRVQFGAPIGTFQALQHRAARLYIDIELCRSATMHAHAMLDAGTGAADVARAASLAKAKCSDVLLQVALEGLQMHGGIGMTEEHDIGLYLKRARVAEMTFGDAAWHRSRWGDLGGY